MQGRGSHRIEAITAMAASNCLDISCTCCDAVSACCLEDWSPLHMLQGKSDCRLYSCLQTVTVQLVVAIKADHCDSANCDTY